MMHDSWIMEYDRLNVLSFWTILCPLPPPTMDPENQNFEKMKKTPGDIILQMSTINDSHMMYGSWNMRYEVQQIEFFIILDCFLPFYHPNKPKTQNFEKLKKTHGDIIIWKRCTKNDNDMMYGSWDMEGDRQNFLPFWIIICPLITP